MRILFYSLIFHAGSAALYEKITKVSLLLRTKYINALILILVLLLIILILFIIRMSRICIFIVILLSNHKHLLVFMIFRNHDDWLLMLPNVFTLVRYCYLDTKREIHNRNSNNLVCYTLQQLWYFLGICVYFLFINNYCNI